MAAAIATGDEVSAGAGAAGSEADDTATLLDELEAESGAAAKPAGKPGKGRPVVEDGDEDAELEATEEDADADLDEADEDIDADAEEDDGDEDDLATKADADPELAKRLAAVRKTEQRQRQALERDRAAFDRERTEWQAQTRQLTEAQQGFQRLAARAKYDPTAALLGLGLKEDDLESAAQHIYARSKAPAVKPEHRAAADRAMKEREHADELAETRRELKELREGLTTREKQAAEQAEVDQYLGRITKIASSERLAEKLKLEAPLVRARLAANPKATRDGLAVTAYKLAQKLGERPKPAAVIRAHEKELQRLRRELAGETTAQPAVGAKPSGKPAAKPAKAGAKPAIAADDDTTGEVRHPSRDELLRELKAGAHLAS